MRHLVWAALFALAACADVDVLARGPDGITVLPLMSNLQAAEDEAVQHCRRTLRAARMVGTVGDALRYECR